MILRFHKDESINATTNIFSQDNGRLAHFDKNPIFERVSSHVWKDFITLDVGKIVKLTTCENQGSLDKASKRQNEKETPYLKDTPTISFLAEMWSEVIIGSNCHTW